MKKLIAIICLLVAGCMSVPVSQTFPTAPPELLRPAPDLKLLTTPNPQLSDLIDNANDNYAEYWILKNKYEEWIEWYNTQKKIYNSAK